MKKKQAKKIPNKFIITISIILVIAFIFLNLKHINKATTAVVNQSTSNQINNVNSHTSQDLKIFFQYPKNLHVEEKDYNIMITSYVTRFGEKNSANTNQIKVLIYNANLCQKTLDEEVVVGGCGEGNWEPTKILDKEIQKLSSGIFYKYTIKHPSWIEQTKYYLEKGNRILKISKEPDPSQFEKEFEEIINSIKFL